MLANIITGGQTGVDQAAWRMAVKWGYKTSGMMPKGFLTEDGPRPEFRGLFGAMESRSAEYVVRTQRNVNDSEAVLWLGPTGSPGYLATLKACSHSKNGLDNPLEKSTSRRFIEISDMRKRLEWTGGMIPTRDFLMGLTTVCIAGSRESRNPGIGELTGLFLEHIFQMIQEKIDWDLKECGKNLALRGRLFEEGPIEEPLEEDLETQFKEAAAHRVSPPLALPPD